MIIIARLDQTWGGQILNNMLGLSIANPVTSQLDDLVSQWATELDSRIGLNMNSTWSWNSVTFYDADAAPGTPPFHVSTANLPLVGRGTESALPKQTSTLIKHVCSGGPPWRGRTYLGGVDESGNVGAGVLLSTLCTELDAMFAAWAAAVKTEFTASDFLAVVRRAAPGVPAVAAEITQSVCSPFWATQRSRSAFS